METQKQKLMFCKLYYNLAIDIPLDFYRTTRRDFRVPSWLTAVVYIPFFFGLSALFFVHLTPPAYDGFMEAINTGRWVAAAFMSLFLIWPVYAALLGIGFIHSLFLLKKDR